jgi:hypothetical protein
LIGLLLASLYGYAAFFTTTLKGTGLDMLFLGSGILVAPIGMSLLWCIEAIGLVSDPGMGGGILISALGAYILWVVIFSLVPFLVLQIYGARKNH